MVNGLYISSRENATRTAGLSTSGPKVEAIPATTKGTRGWRAGGAIFNKIASRAHAKAVQAQRVLEKKAHGCFVTNRAYPVEVKHK